MRRPLKFGMAIPLLLLSLSGVVHAQSTGSTSVSLVFHSVPDDPTSSVSLTVTFLISPTAIDGNNVGWSIDAAYFMKPTENDGIKKWQSGPLEVLNSVDGLWWTTHADVSAPSEAEFTVLPTLVGLGDPENPADTMLFFVIEGTESTVISDPTAPYALQTAYGRYLFADGGGGFEGDDDPVEVDRSNDPQVH